MSYMPATRPDDALKRFLLASLALHLAILSFAALRMYLMRSGEGWGGPEGAITVGVVGSVPAIPLPHSEVETPNRVVDESKGLYKAEPKPVPPAERRTPAAKAEKAAPLVAEPPLPDDPGPQAEAEEEAPKKRFRFLDWLAGPAV